MLIITACHIFLQNRLQEAAKANTRQSFQYVQQLGLK